MQHPGLIRPEWDGELRAHRRPVYCEIACALLAVTVPLTWVGLIDPVVVLVAALLAPPLFEVLDGDAGPLRMAIDEAFPEPATPPCEEELDLLAMSMTWATGTGGCPWPIAFPPGRHLTRHAQGRSGAL